MKNTKYIFLILTFYSCTVKNINQNETNSQVTELELVQTKILDIQEFKKLQPDPCDTFSIEVENIYPEMRSLPPAHLDTAYLDNALKNLGYDTFSSGWGNFQGGPRMLYLGLSDGRCSCYVYKKYILVDSIGDNGQTEVFFKIVEKIVCNAPNNAVD